MDPEELRNRDKRMAAIHEAAHVVVAVATGGRARAWLSPTNTSNPLYEKEWVGRCETFGRVTPATAVAGAVAEFLEDDPESESWEVLDYLESEEFSLSETDREMLGESDLETAIIEAMALLRQNAEFLNWVVAQLLMDENVVTDGMAYDYFHNIKW